MTQTISKFIQLEEVSNEHSMETQQIKKGKASSNNDFFLSLSFQIKGKKMKLLYKTTSSQNLFHCCIMEWVTNDPNGDKHFAKPSQATSLTPFFGPWIQGHWCNANKQKASLCFIVLLMSPLVSNHLIPQMLRNRKVKISFILPSKFIAKG